MRRPHDMNNLGDIAGTNSAGAVAFSLSTGVIDLNQLGAVSFGWT